MSNSKTPNAAPPPMKLEDTPVYLKALDAVWSDMLGQAITDLADARAKVVVFRQHSQGLQQQVEALTKTGEDTPSEETPKKDKVEPLTRAKREAESERRERRAQERLLEEAQKENARLKDELKAKDEEIAALQEQLAKKKKKKKKAAPVS